MIELYEYEGKLYPDYLKRGNAQQYIQPVALKYCIGDGVDVGCGDWPLPGAIPIDIRSTEWSAGKLPDGPFDYVFSSHCLEHLEFPLEALGYWKTKLKSNGTLFLYLPHPDMTYWLPGRCPKHRHIWYPSEIAAMLGTLGFKSIMYSERDLAWGFAAVGFNR